MAVDPAPATKSQDLAKELQKLEEELAALRARAEDEESTYIELQEQAQEMSGKLALTRGALADYEARLVEKQAELARATFEDVVQARDEAAARLAEDAARVLASLEAFERAQEDVAAFEPDRDTGDLQPVPDVHIELWEELVTAVRKHIDEQFEDELVEAASRSVKPGAIDELPPHLREAARERARARLQSDRGRR